MDTITPLDQHWTPGSVTGALEALALKTCQVEMKISEVVMISVEAIVTLECVVLIWSGPNQQLNPAAVDKISNFNFHFNFRFGLIMSYDHTCHIFVAKYEWFDNFFC